MDEQELRRFDDLWRARGRLAVALPVLLLSLLGAAALAYFVPSLPSDSGLRLNLLLFGAPVVVAGVVTSIPPIIQAIRLGA